MYLSSVSSRLLLHDTNSWDLKISNGCYDGIIRDLTWSDDSKYILQINSAGLVEILSPTDRDVRSLQHIPLKDTWSASFHRDGHSNVAVGTKSGNVKIWDTKNKNITKTFPTPSHPSCVQILSYNAKNTSLAATMTNGETVIYDLVSNIPVLSVKLTCSKSISAMKFHHESRSLVGLATDEGHVILRDITTNKDKAFFENIHASPVSDFAFSLINKDVMLSSGFDKVIQVYDIRLQSIVSTVKTTHTLTSIAINTDNLVALGSKNGDVLVYDLRDFSRPLKILKGHNQQVSKVSFQPSRKKMITDISLKEEVESVSVHKIRTPNPGKSSDIFFMRDTPPNHNMNFSTLGADNRTDLTSYLVTVGLDKSNNFDNDLDFDFERNSEKHEQRINTERIHMSNVSTPVNKSAGENFDIPSPSSPNRTQDDNKTLISDLPNGKSLRDIQTAINVDSKVVDELKDFISNVADDNRNYFLHIMMALTKQKLYLEKQLNRLSQQVHNLEQNQNSLVEANRMLTLLVEQMKMHQNNACNYK